MNEKLLTILEEYGLNEKESRLYLVVLELGSAPASTIARRAGLKRVTAYAILQEMVRKGVLHVLEKTGSKSFHVVNPQQLVAQRQVKCDAFTQALPEFAALADVWGNKPRIEYFEGVGGIKKMYDDLLTSREPLYSFLGTSTTNEPLLEYLYNDFLPRRIDAEIYAEVLVGSHDKDLAYALQDETAFKETRIIDNEYFNIEVDIDMYGPGKVAFMLFSDDEMSGFIVHSHRLYESLLGIFRTLWQQGILSSTYKTQR